MTLRVAFVLVITMIGVAIAAPKAKTPTDQVQEVAAWWGGVFSTEQQAAGEGIKSRDVRVWRVDAPAA
jgi:hypothetical protein